MQRRRFLQGIAASAVALRSFASAAGEAVPSPTPEGEPGGAQKASEISVEGHTLLCTFSREAARWKVYEDLRTRDGVVTFISSTGTARVLPKSAEATFADDGPQHLGLDLKDIGLADRDLLADKLLASGDPSEDDVRRAAPPHRLHAPRRVRLSAYVEHYRRHPRMLRHYAGLSAGQYADLSPRAVLPRTQPGARAEAS